MLRRVFTAVAIVVSASVACPQAHAQVTHAGTNTRWLEVTSNMPFPESLASAAAQAAYNEGVADGSITSKPGIIGVNGRASMESFDPATGKWCRGLGRNGAEQIEVYPESIAHMVQTFLTNVTGGAGASERDCLETDIAISTIFHELCHTLINTGKSPDDSMHWEYECTCLELWFWCEIMDSDPKYGPGGAKKAVGDVYKEYKHKLKDYYFVLQGPQF